MTGLLRTSLPTSQKVDLAACALAAQGCHGMVSELARSHEVSRPTVYAAGSTAEAVLSRHFERAQLGCPPVEVTVDEAQVKRTVVALRVMAPNSLRSIEDLLPILYPGWKPSYGWVQSVTAEAEERARALNARAELSGVEAGALDEMFSQGEPVLAGVDLDSTYLFALSLRESRSSTDWAEVLGEAKNQGLSLKIAVKDAARGIEAGVRKVFPEAEQRDDCFHALYAMGREQQRLERKGYGALAEIEQAREAHLRHGRTGRGDRWKSVSRHALAHQRCAKVLELHDRFEQAARKVREALWFIDLDSGMLRTAEQMQSAIDNAAHEMMELSDPRCRKVGRYLKNRTPGLASHLHPLNLRLRELCEIHGEIPVRLACLIHRLNMDLTNRWLSWKSHENKRSLHGACLLLRQHADRHADAVVADVEDVLHHRHRASSAVEGFNAALRPYLYVHKGVTQGFLELFRAYYNLRTRRWGRHKGTSPHQCLTGEPVNDWLSRLGYPQSRTLH